MKAMIFAAGLGTRLRPLTNDRPKALVEVGGVTMLERVIMHMKESGVTEIVVNVHHFGQKIIDFLSAKQNFGINIKISDERNLLLDTGGAIKKARPLLGENEPFIVHNADILTDIDLKSFYKYHIEHNALATVLVKPRKTQRYLLFDNTERLRGWVNKKTLETKPVGFVYNVGEFKELAFGGLHVMSPQIFDLLDKYTSEEVFSIISFYTAECNSYKIQGFQPNTNYKWLDVGKPETLAQAAELFK